MLARMIKGQLPILRQVNYVGERIIKLKNIKSKNCNYKSKCFQMNEDGLKGN